MSHRGERKRMRPQTEGNSTASISVVIPTRNSVQFLKESIDSVLGQSYPAHEVIVVDGASEDGTEELCKQYSAKIRYFRQERNEGFAAALNMGIMKMSGDWFKQHDADDVLEPNALQVLAERAGRTDAPVIFGDFVHMDSRGRLLKYHAAELPTTRTDFVLASWHRLVVSHLAAMVRRSAFETVGLFDSTLEMSEDYDWFVRAALIKGIRFEHVPVVLARYRRHARQISITRDRGWARRPLHRKLMDAKYRSLLLNEGSEELRDYYCKLTRRLRLAYAPLLSASSLAGRLPKRVTLSYYLLRICPRFADQLYWAANPPLSPADCGD